VTTSLPGYRRPRGEWLPTAVTAVLAAGVISGAARISVEAERNAVFMAGPLVLLAGLHPRLWGYLHAPARLQLLPLPLGPDQHFVDALARHRRRFAIAVVIGTIVFALNAVWAPLHRPRSDLLDWAWFVILAAAIEPATAAAGAHFGRRFEPGSHEYVIQHRLSGGWTIPEAAIYLYAPALGVALAMALAMPGQLSIDRWMDGGSLQPSHIMLMVVPAAFAVGLRVVAPRIWGASLFEAVPWVAEASRTLDGPATPHHGHVLRCIGSPALRMWLAQVWRLTPVPALRVVALLGWSALVGLGAVAPDAVVLGVGLLLIAAWLMPLGTVFDERRRISSIMAPLPLTGTTAAAVATSTVVLTPVAIALWVGVSTLTGGLS